MYLSRLVLNPRSRAVRRDLADCHALHQTILSAFPEVAPPEARAALGVLYRLEAGQDTAGPILLVQSLTEPDWTRLAGDDYVNPRPGSVATKAVGHLFARIEPAARLRFRLRANPTRRLATPPAPDGRRPSGKRVEIRDEAAQIAWLRRKGRDHGFELPLVPGRPDVVAVRAVQEPAQVGYRTSPHPAEGGPRQRLTLAAVTFDGVLVVHDAAAFRAALEAGIGSGKAYGFGLLSVAPSREEA